MPPVKEDLGGGFAGFFTYKKDGKHRDQHHSVGVEGKHASVRADLMRIYLLHKIAKGRTGNPEQQSRGTAARDLSRQLLVV